MDGFLLLVSFRGVDVVACLDLDLDLLTKGLIDVTFIT